MRCASVQGLDGVAGCVGLLEEILVGASPGRHKVFTRIEENLQVDNKGEHCDFGIESEGLQIPPQDLIEGGGLGVFGALG